MNEMNPRQKQFSLNRGASRKQIPISFYTFSEEGKSTVIKAGRKFEKIAESTLPDGFMASPAVDAKALILRTKTSLYRIEE